MKWFVIAGFSVLCVSAASADTITFTVSAADKARIVAAVAQTQNYQATVPDPSWTPEPTPGIPNPTPRPMVTNPETQGQFALRYLREFLLRVVRASDDQKAVATARAVVEATPTPAIQ